MIAGRKLLLADDSIAIQRVVDLTFTDEGMEVTTVGDGQDALEKLNQFTPDVVLADVFMPGVDGYELCKFIKENERFRGVPVMLLVGSFEPFDEAAAKSAGADDVVTKPFQSIRDLVNRVGSLVSHDEAARQEAASKYSVLGLSQTEERLEADDAIASVPSDSMLMDEHLSSEPQVKVFVEAPTMEPDATVLLEAPVMETEPADAPEHYCPPVIDLQTADTQELRPISDAAPVEAEQTVELEFVNEDDGNEPVEASSFDDEGVLDLGDIDGFSAASASEDDFVLDVDIEPVTVSDSPIAPVSEPAPSEPVHAAIDEFDDDPESAFEMVQEPTLTRVTDEPADEMLRAEISAAPVSEHAPTSELSSEAIEAISRRVVEQLSEKVVREIAWEVVPELSELLIKRRLDEQR